MRFNIELDMDNFVVEEEFNETWMKDAIMQAIGYELINEYSIDNQIINNVVTKLTQQLTSKENIKKITDKVIENVTSHVAKKREVKEQMPTATEIKALDAAYKKYFSELINECIAKKFK